MVPGIYFFARVVTKSNSTNKYTGIDSMTTDILTKTLCSLCLKIRTESCSTAEEYHVTVSFSLNECLSKQQR